jgi:hypothetical protein
MMMRALKTIENYVPGRRVAAGELFEPASAADARVLALAQLAEVVDDEPPRKPRRYKRSDMQAEE